MDGSNFSVAIIDDEEPIRKALSRLLHSVGMQARTYVSAQDFLSRWRVEVPSCIVIDLHMPDFDGLALIKCLQQLGANLPIVIITAHDEAVMPERCMAAGASAYLCKPLDDHIFLETIRQVCAA